MPSLTGVPLPTWLRDLQWLIPTFMLWTQMATKHSCPSTNSDNTVSLAFQTEQEYDLWAKTNATAFFYNLNSKLALGPC